MKQDNINKILEFIERTDQRLEKIEEKLFGEEKIIIEKKFDSSKSKEKSFVEFYLDHKPKNETDKTLVIMNFLERAREIENITSKDISQAFKEVREKPPVNVSDKIQMLHKRGLIMPGEIVNNMKGWMITRTGLEYLEKIKNE